jgi:hypothetical protein
MQFQVSMMKLNTRGHTLVELLIVVGMALFVLQAVYFLQSGFMGLFKDVKTRSENIQTKIPSMELVSRYFDRWGVNVIGNGTAGGANCGSYPPSHARCVTVSPVIIDSKEVCDQVIFWGNLYGFGFVNSVASGTSSLASCRLGSDSSHNRYYIWSSDTLYNDVLKDANGNIIYVIPLRLGSLSADNADCSNLTAGSPTNATASSSLTPPTWVQTFCPFLYGVTCSETTKYLQAGDVIQRAPHRVRLYCAKNSGDNDKLWLYVRLIDTADNVDEGAVAIAPVMYEEKPSGNVKGLEAQLLPSGCDASTGGCLGARVWINFRSQSQTTARQYATQRVERVYSR